MNFIVKALSSKSSQIIYVFLFIYLFGFGLAGLWLKGLEPSATIQLIFGNYTNVLGALGASIAAGSGVAAVSKLHVIHSEQKEHHAKMSKYISGKGKANVK